MERTSIYLPRYLDGMLSLVSVKLGDGKAKILRNAVLRELFRLTKKVQKLKPGDAFEPFYAMHPAADTEMYHEWLRRLHVELRRSIGALPPARRNLQP